MKKSEETLEDFAISYPLDKLAPLEQILFLDIETTGFSLLSVILQETIAIWYISTAIILTFPLSPRNVRS